MRRVNLESPYAKRCVCNDLQHADRRPPPCAPQDQVEAEHLPYARAAIRDMVVRFKEAPIASHLLFTQKGILDDTNREERALGITAGLCWNSCAEATVVYIDYGISAGMVMGIQAAHALQRPVEYRSLKAFAAKKGSTIFVDGIDVGLRGPIARIAYDDTELEYVDEKAEIGVCRVTMQDDDPTALGKRFLIRLSKEK